MYVILYRLLSEPLTTWHTLLVFNPAGAHNEQARLAADPATRDAVLVDVNEPNITTRTIPVLSAFSAA